MSPQESQIRRERIIQKQKRPRKTQEGWNIFISHLIMPTKKKSFTNEIVTNVDHSYSRCWFQCPLEDAGLWVT